jgi:methyl-accepting chemotaxis protein
MRFHNLRTGTKILGAFAVVSLATLLISLVSLWRMDAADRMTRDLVDNKLARQQATSELLGIARLNGVRTVSIARSDSLELGDYFQAQLTKGEGDAALLEARLRALPAGAGEAALAERAARAKAAWLDVRKQVFQAKEFGKTQEVEQLAANALAKTFDAYTGALEAQLAAQATQAHALADASADDFVASRALLLGFGGAALLVGGGAAWLLTRSIVTPLQQAVRLAERVAEGDLSATIAHRRGDEIGRMFDALNHMTQGMSAAVVRVLDSARMIDQASAEMADGNRDLSDRTEEQASSLHETVRAMVELTEAVEQNHVNANEANALALAASNVAQQGADAVAQMVERMDTIRESAARINDITSMIDGIAFQTNILALNAAVEAARAGAEGRGFAVVAAEVRNLAQHSASAAKEIKVLIGASTGAIESGAGIAGAAGGTMRQILERVLHVTQLLQKINAASSEQASGIAQVRKVIDEMEHATQQNAAMVEQAAASAETMRAQAEQLTEVVATFRVRDDVAQEVTRGAGMVEEVRRMVALPAPAPAPAFG